jgi:hypothetical protein
MTRLVLLAWILAGGAVAGFVFQMSNEVADLEKELTAVERDILGQQRALHVLRAEWSYLNRPERLSELSQKHLSLAPVPAERVIGISDLPLRPIERISAQSAALEGFEITKTQAITEPRGKLKP